MFTCLNQKNINIKSLAITISKILNKEIKIKYSSLKKGDTIDSLSNSKKIIKYTGYSPKTKLQDGLKKFLEWYKSYYNI